MPGQTTEEERKKKKAEIEALRKKYEFLDDPSHSNHRTWVPPGGSNSSSSGRGCCVVRFDYPVHSDKSPRGPTIAPMPSKIREGGDASGRIVTFGFDTFIRYNPESPCDCICCTFRRFIIVDQVDVLKSKRKMAPGSTRRTWKRDSKPLFTRPKGEDCWWLVMSHTERKYVKVRGDVNGPHTDPNAGSRISREDPELAAEIKRRSPTVGPLCYGDRQSGQKRHEDAKAAGYRKHDETKTLCTYEAKDDPEEWIPIGMTFAWQITFLGVVYDRCNGWPIRRVEEYAVAIVGNSGGSEDGTGVIFD